MFIFEKNKFFPSCHASTLVEGVSGDLLVAWFAGTTEGADDVDIWLSIKHGEEWSKPRKVVNMEGIPLWNPVLMRDEKTIFLFYRFGHKIKDWKSAYVTSEDNGQNWSEPKLLPAEYLGPIKNKPIKMSNGLWLCGSSIETAEEWYCRLEIFDAKSRQWLHYSNLKLPEVPIGIIQPALWESSPGNVHALMRSTIGKVVRSDSSDYGKTWSTPVSIEIPNNNSGIDAVHLPDGNVILCLNPVTKNWGERTPLELWRSKDNGMTWSSRFTLENEPGRYSYPALISTKDGVGVTYTYRRESIRYRKVQLEEFIPFSG